MPACHRCHKGNQPRSSVRRTKLGFVCKEKLGCRRRRREAMEQRAA